MRIGRVALCVALVATGVLGGAGAAAAAAASPVAPADPPAGLPARVIVKYRAGVTATAARTHAKGLGATVKDQIVGPAVPHGRLVVVTSDTLTAKQLVARFAADPRVEYAEPDVVRTVDAAPNDPRYLELWGLQQIYAPRAWSVSTGAASVVVASIDSGVDFLHADLVNNTWWNTAEYHGTPGVDDDGNGYVDDTDGWDAIDGDGKPGDPCGHGTHTAGTIAGIGNNGIGVVGVGWKTKVLPCRFLNADGDGYLSDEIECLNYVLAQKQHGVNVVAINASYGSTEYSTAEYNAISAAGTAGILFVAAAGNDGHDDDVTPHYPSAYNLSNIISVAATDSHNRLAFFSNWGATSVDLAAPGRDILSTVPTGVNATGYDTYSGTSMAAPHVTGAVALCAAAFPTETMSQRKARVLLNTDASSTLTGKVWSGGELDVARALGSGAPTSADIPGLPMVESYLALTMGATTSDVVYRVYLKAGAQMSARITTPSDADFDLYLFGRAATTVTDKGIALASDTGAASFKYVTYTAPATGFYYLDIARVSGSGNYGLACNSDKDDIPGVPFPDGDVISWIDYSEVTDNVYSVPLGYGEKVTASIVSPPAGADFHIFLFAPERFTTWQAFDASLTTGDYPRTLTMPCWKSGTYYVDYFAKAGGGWVTFTHSVAAAGDNDIPGVPIVGSGHTHELSRDLDREDVWAIDLTSYQTLTVSITGDAATTDFDLFVFPWWKPTVEGHTGWGAASQTAAYPETVTFTAEPDPHLLRRRVREERRRPVHHDVVDLLRHGRADDDGDGAAGERDVRLAHDVADRHPDADRHRRVRRPADRVLGRRHGVRVHGAVHRLGLRQPVVTYSSTDYATNREVTKTGYVNIDVTPPVTLAGGLMEEKEWRNTPATVRLEASDAQSGVRRAYYELDEVVTPYAGAFTVERPGVHVVRYWSDDRAGNEERPSVGFVNIDVTAPEVTGATLSPAATAAGWNNADVTVAIAATDDGGAGVGKRQYAVAGSGVWTDATGGKFTVPAPADHGNDGVHTFDLRAIDRAGNISPTRPVTVRIDTRAPVTYDSGDDLWHATGRGPDPRRRRPRRRGYERRAGEDRVLARQRGDVGGGHDGPRSRVWRRGGGSGVHPGALPLDGRCRQRRGGQGARGAGRRAAAGHDRRRTTRAGGRPRDRPLDGAGQHGRRHRMLRRSRDAVLPGRRDLGRGDRRGRRRARACTGSPTPRPTSPATPSTSAGRDRPALTRSGRGHDATREAHILWGGPARRSQGRRSADGAGTTRWTPGTSRRRRRDGWSPVARAVPPSSRRRCRPD